jgi:hypothetical protein
MQTSIQSTILLYPSWGALRRRRLLLTLFKLTHNRGVNSIEFTQAPRGPPEPLREGVEVRVRHLVVKRPQGIVKLCLLLILH